MGRWSLVFRKQANALLALVFVTAALVYLSVQFVRGEAAARRQLTLETYRSVADLVSARVNTAMTETDHAIASIATAGSSASLSLAIDEFERDRPWAAPVVLLPTDLTGRSHVGTRADELDGTSETPALFKAKFDAAETAEFRSQQPEAAAALYGEAFDSTSENHLRTLSLFRLARCKFTAGSVEAAVKSYRRLIETFDLRDGREVVLAAMAYAQLPEGYVRLARNVDRTRALVAGHTFLLTYRFLIDPDHFEFYSHLSADRLRRATLDAAETAAYSAVQARWERVDRIEKIIADVSHPEMLTMGASGPAGPAYVSTGTAAVVLTRLRGAGSASSSVQIAHVWTAEAATVLLTRIASETGPWSGMSLSVAPGANQRPPATTPAGVAVSSTGLSMMPGYRVAAVPQAGSLEEISGRTAAKLGLIVTLVLATVIAALVLSVRSIGREIQLAELRAEFVSSVSHELRTPLASIRMFAENLRSGWVDKEKQAGYYEVISRESERLTDLISNVLDFSRLERGARSYRLLPTDLRALVAGVLDRYAFHLNVSGIALHQTLPDEPVFGSVDRDAIEQVVTNLLSNAMKYMGDRPGAAREVQVTLTFSSDTIVLKIGDTGIGIAPADRVRIFDRFYRAADPRVRSVAGSGLGLTLVRAHVDAHGGSVSVESLPAGGTMFAIRLPIRGLA